MGHQFGANPTNGLFYCGGIFIYFRIKSFPVFHTRIPVSIVASDAQ